MRKFLIGLLAASMLVLPFAMRAPASQEGSGDDPLQEFRKQVDSDLAKELGSTFPSLGGWLRREVTTPDDPLIHSALVHVLDREEDATNGVRPAMMLAADRLADKLSCDKKDSVECTKMVDEMAGYHLTWAWGELGASWIYQHDLLWAINKDYPSGPWGEDAFILLMDQGWDTSGVCRKGAEQFREVIKQGEAFLASHPGSPHRAEVLFLVAQAYDTWWSLSKAPKTDDYVDAKQYEHGAAGARKEAINKYEEVVRIAPAGLLSLTATKALDALRQGKDTKERRFFCIYD